LAQVYSINSFRGYHRLVYPALSRAATPADSVKDRLCAFPASFANAGYSCSRDEDEQQQDATEHGQGLRAHLQLPSWRAVRPRDEHCHAALILAVLIAELLTRLSLVFVGQ
jgi:hypothetical protein